MSMFQLVMERHKTLIPKIKVTFKFFNTALYAAKYIIMPKNDRKTTKYY